MAAAIGAMVQIAAAGQAAQAHQQAGQDRARAYREQAEQAESAAKDRELERLVRLRTTLASQRAYWSGAGIDATSGSPTTVASRSYETFELDQGADLINTRQQIRSFNNSADAAVRMGNIKARGSILGGVMGAANTWNS
jgi:hypothetical protein|tara:strand:+ start:351 stop:767 length:417 start_codon:yes stop_codon:yes gene_type:complete